MIDINFIKAMQIQGSFKSSTKPQHLSIPAEIIDTIKNSELKYEFKSEFYINVPEKSQLNIILFLCLYDSEKMSTKKIISALKEINLAQMKELNEEYFNARNLDNEKLSLPSKLEKLANKFSYHESLIIRLAPIFQKLSIVSLFNQDLYKNKLQIREFLANKQSPFNQIAFKAVNQTVRNDIIIIPNLKGYYIACYSTEKPSQNRDSFMKKQDIKAISMKQQIKEEDVLDEEELKLFIKEEQEKKKKQLSKQKLLQPTEEVNSAKKAKEDRYELYSIIALGIIFLLILYEAAPIFLK